MRIPCAYPLRRGSTVSSQAMNFKETTMSPKTSSEPLPASSAKAATPAETPKRRPVNTSLDAALVETLDRYIEKNPRAGDRSTIIERELLKLLKSKARRFRLKLPAHLLTR